jgi:hypothetical protein
MHRSIRSAVVGLAMAAVLAGVAVPSVAQTTSVTSGDIDRLQVAMEDARRDVSELRSRNATLAGRLQTQLDELGEEVIYLKVLLRKQKSVARTEYSQLRDRIDDLRTQARTNSGTYPPVPTTSSSPAPSAPSARTAATNEIPVGQELDVRLQSALNSNTAKPEDRFEATTVVDLYQGDRILVPAGSAMRGVVTSVDPATRTDRRGSLTVSFDQITVNGRDYPIRATVTSALESEGIKGETGRIATGAGVGAVIGGILGGFRGALAGILIGGGGTIAATEGTDVNLAAGTVLRVRFDSPATIR